MKKELKDLIDECKPILKKRATDGVVREGVCNGRPAMRSGKSNGKGWQPPFGRGYMGVVPGSGKNSYIVNME